MTRTKAGGIVNDDALKLSYGYAYWPFQIWAGLLSVAATVDTTFGVGTTASLESELSVAASEVKGFAIQAVSAELYHILDRRGDFATCDFTRPIHFQIDWEHGSADADTPTFTLDFKGVAAAEAVSDAKVSPDVQLSFAATALAVSGAVNETPWVSSGVQSAWASDKKILMAFSCTSLGSASANEIKLLGVRARWTKTLCNDEGAELT